MGGIGWSGGEKKLLDATSLTYPYTASAAGIQTGS